MARENSTKTQDQFLASQEGWQLIDAKDLSEVWSKESEKGLPVFFREGDTITFGTALKTVPFKTGIGTTVNIGHIAAQCERFGWFWFPISIFRRAPIEAERDQLYREENSFGAKLLMNMRDYERAKLVTGKTLKVTSVLDLHKPGFDRQANKPDYENLSRQICYCFQEA